MKDLYITDILIIGGGMAGLLAAIKARKTGADVILVDKAYAGKSGQSPYADSLCPFKPEWGHDLNEWLKAVSITGEYINNPEWTEMVFKGSFKIYEQFVKWGVDFYKNDDGSLYTKKGEQGGSTIFFSKNQAPERARKEAIQLGVKIFDRIMITQLIKNNDKVIGAAGISAETADLHIFNSKATVMCAGAAGFKPNGWPIHELTGDADALAYRVGAKVLGKEFIDTHSGSKEHPAFLNFAEDMQPGAKPMTGVKFKRVFNAEGNPLEFTGTALWLSKEFEIHAGRGPVSAEMPDGSIVAFAGGTSLGMASHKTEGIVSKDLSCATTVDGLFAAGDALGNMAAGAKYPFMGFAITHACVTGCLAGVNAAKYALKAENAEISQKVIKEICEETFHPLRRKGGFSPRWVLQIIQNTLSPYFILYIKHGERLKAALTYIEFVKNNLVPKLKADDAHDLRLAHEVANIVLNAEIKLRSSLARKESRGCHYREDYPRRDDKNFLAWIQLENVAGKMTVSIEPIPEKFLPDKSIPYEQKYPLRIPGEIITEK
ncbi:MAG: FAD-binding protein [Lentisphaerae bacterium]|nr:FAD-binding protein [Lentisphaerota bacterium]MCP4101352.1 FAD-binding protein [Lentisphaerota bacterium]